MSELTPITRIESYLDAIVNSGTPPTEDITRIETFLQAIYDNTVCALTPITRIEMFLGKISGQDIVLPDPITRIELYLAVIAGEDVELPENPITRLEMYLAEWADSGDWTTISGAIVEFITQRAHKIKSCVVSLEPQQDLHGYDSPWPDGGGKNKYNKDALDSASDYVDYFNSYFYSSPIYLKPNTAYIMSPTSTASLGVSDYYVLYINSSEDDPDVIISQTGVFLYPVGAGTPATVRFTTGATGVIRFGVIAVSSGTGIKTSALEAFMTIDYQIEEGSTATAYAPYSNICPISGWTGVSVWDTGHNMWDEEWEVGGINDTTGEKTVVSSQIRSKNYIPVKAEEPYYVYNANHSSVSVYVYYYDLSHGYIGRATIGGAYNVSNSIVTPPSGVAYLMIKAGTLTTYNHDISINYPSTDTEYHSYQGNSYSVTWEDEAGTVYGGTVDLVSGVLTVERAKYIVDGINNTISYGSTYCNIAPYGVIDSVQSIGTWKCSIFRSSTAYFGYNGTSKFVFFTRSAANLIADTAEGFNAYCQQNPIEFVYKLSTPITIQLTPQQITALKGYNAVWSNAGNVTVTFRGTPIVEPDAVPLLALNLLLGGAYRNDQTPEDVPDDEALAILLGGADR